MLELKFETYLEKKKFMLFHSIEVIFRVVMAIFSFGNKASKKPRVNKVAKTKEVGKWNFKQSFRTLIVGLPSMVCMMTILCAFLASLFYIIATMFNGKFASSFRSLSIGDRPWGSSPKWEVSLDPLPRSIFNGEMVVTSVEVVVLLFCACFQFGAFALVIVRSS